MIINLNNEEIIAVIGAGTCTTTRLSKDTLFTQCDNGLQQVSVDNGDGTMTTTSRDADGTISVSTVNTSVA
jgi:hypothetical protein